MATLVGARRRCEHRFRAIVLVSRLRLRITRRRHGSSANAGGGTHNEKRPLVAATRRHVGSAATSRRSCAPSRSPPRRNQTDERRRERDEHLRSWRVADPAGRGALRDDPAPQGWEAELRAHPVAAGSQRSVGAAVPCSQVGLVNDLFGFTALTRSAARPPHRGGDRTLLHRRRDPDITQRPGPTATSPSSTRPTPSSGRSPRRRVRAPVRRSLVRVHA